jgi:superfamily II DNA/RNA helicase
MGFLPEVKRLLDACAPKRQTLLFSATLDGDVDVIIRRYMHDPVRHEEAGADSDGDTAEHLYWSVERADRIDLVGRIVSRTGPTVVFCRTKRGADRVAKQLGTRGVAAVAIHGDRSQSQRERALDDFKSGRARAIIATDVAARGIHVDGVSCVIHFDPSEDPKDYVHRSGRTGRAGATGTVISLVSKEQRRDMSRQQRSLGRDIQIVAPDPASLPEAPPFVTPPARPQRPTGGGGGGGGRNKGGGGGGRRKGGRPGGKGASGSSSGNSGNRGSGSGGSSNGGSSNGSRRPSSKGRSGSAQRAGATR